MYTRTVMCVMILFFPTVLKRYFMSHVYLLHASWHVSALQAGQRETISKHSRDKPSILGIRRSKEKEKKKKQGKSNVQIEKRECS